MGKEEKLEMINIKTGRSIYLDPNMKISDFMKTRKLINFLKDYRNDSDIIIRKNTG